MEALKDEGRSSSSLSAGRFTSGLVIAEVAGSCGLLIAAGLAGVVTLASLVPARWVTNVVR